jgi:CBS domain-containing protein
LAHTIKVEDLMVPVAEYATVAQDANLYEAVMALAQAQAEWRSEDYKHRAILVLDHRGKVVGKISQFDAIRALEPKYLHGDFSGVTRSGVNPELIRDILNHHQLFQDPLDEICHTAARKRVKDFMYTPQRDEYVRQDATLAEAMHLLYVGQHQSLLVTDRQGGIVGILRLSDVFNTICERIKTCEL